MTPVATRTGKRAGQRLVNGPAAHQPHIDGVGLYAKLFGPVVDVLRSAIKGKHSAFAAIANLCSSGGPAAILGRVVAIVIDAVNRIALVGPWSHIFVKGGKVVLPSRTNFNPSPAVISILAVVGVIAPRLDVTPMVVLRSKAQSVSGSILSGLFAVHNEIVPDLEVM